MSPPGIDTFREQYIGLMHPPLVVMDTSGSHGYIVPCIAGMVVSGVKVLSLPL